MKTLFTTIIILSFCIALNGQSIADNQLTVEKDYHSDIYNVNPIRRNILNGFRIIEEPQTSYDSLISLSPLIPTSVSVLIKPVGFKTNNEEDLYNGNFRINKGTLNEWDGSAEYHYVVDNYFNIDLSANYQKWNESKYFNKQFENIDIKTGIKYYLSDKLLSTITLSGYKNSYGKYGSIRSLGENNGDTNTFDNFNVSSSLRTFNSGHKDINFSIKTNYSTTIFQEGIAKENLILLNPRITKQFGNNINLDLQGSGWVSSNSDINNFNHYNGSLLAKLNMNTLSLTLGGSINYNVNQLRYYPKVEGNFYVSNSNRIIVSIEEKINYIGLNKLEEINPYSSIKELNPFITYNRTHSLAFLLNVNDKLTVQAQINYDRLENELNFNGLDNDQNIDYDLISYDQQSIALTASINHTSYLQTITHLKYNKYDSNTILYLKPIFSFVQTATLSTIDNKLSLELEALLNTAQNLSLTAFTGIETSGMRKNINTKINYKPFDNLTLNVQVNNLLNDDYQVFDKYEVFGMNISGGLLFKF